MRSLSLIQPEKTIWKFGLEARDGVAIDMPKGAEILSLQVQGSTPCIWALCDPHAEPETRYFRTYGTGHPVESEPGRFIGTYQIMNGALVFHVFEVSAPEVN